MKITFQKLKIRNFLSYGNGITEVDLQSAPFTLVVGENGSGKSSLIVDALHFALFGKIIRRGVKQDQVVNTINKSNCYVYLEFTINDKDRYYIERGLDPAILNFRVPEKKPDERSSKKLVQKEIDELLGFDQNTFKSLSVLSLNNSKAFVDLTPEETRNVVENLLGIQVYSLMLEETKKLLKENKDKLKVFEKDYDLYSELVKENKQKFERAEQLKGEFEDKKKVRLETLQREKKSYEDAINNRQEVLSKKNNVEPVKPDLSQYEKMLVLLQKRIDDGNAEILEFNKTIVQNQTLLENNAKRKDEAHKTSDFFKTSTNCPICNSLLTKEHKQKEMDKILQLLVKIAEEDIHSFEMMVQAKDKAIRMNEEVVFWKEKLQQARDKMSQLTEEYNRDLSRFNSAEMQYKMLESEIKGFVGMIQDLEKRIESVKTETVDSLLTELVSYDKIKEYEQKFETIKTGKQTIEDSLVYYEMIKNLLSDNGIKANIVKRDLPFLNSTINQYLKEFGRNYAIEFDEAFNIQITGYAKKGLSYYNLSEGEKKRIDLAILLSFIDLSKKKNSIDINILVFDEIFDTSLDVAGQDAFVKILERKIKAGIIENIFVISHDKNLILPQSQVISVYKEGEFSKITVE